MDRRLSDLPWLRSGERIETENLLRLARDYEISPGFGQGSGLKQDPDVGQREAIQISPGFGQGSGLKLRIPAGNTHL